MLLGQIDTFQSDYDEFVDEFGTELAPMEPRLAPFTPTP
jgi:hypothetical protein